MKKERSIPSILGLILLVLCSFIGVYLTSQRTYFSPKAAGDCQPDNLQMTNITHRSTTISFQTSGQCFSSLNLDNNTFSNLLSSTPYRLHYFEINNLEQQKKYSFSLIIGGKTYSTDQYSFTTAPTPPSTIPSSNLAWGKVYTPDHQPAANVLVYLNIPGAAPLSARTTNEGNWNVSLANSFNDSLTNWFNNPVSPVSEEIIVFSSDGSATQIAHTSSQNNPVPDIIIGQNSLDSSSNNTQQTGEIPSNHGGLAAGSSTLTITNPTEGDVLNTNQPQFFGQASSNTTINLEVHSDTPIQAQAQSDSSGNWSWTPTQPLSPGTHTITAKIYNSSTNLWTTVSRNFTVMAASDGPAFTATPSATIIPSPSPLPTAIQPTSTPQPTITLTTTPVVRSAIVSTSSSTPVTGDTLPTIGLIFFASLFVLASYYLFTSKAKL